MPCPKPSSIIRQVAYLLPLLVLQLVLSACAQAGTSGPAVSSVTPAQGSVAGGEQVTIHGSGFSGGSCGSDYQISFGTDLEHGYAILASNYQVVSDSTITATAPPNFGGQVNVRVHNACGTSGIADGDHFTYQYPTTQCQSGNCSVMIGSSAVGDLRHAALGFLNGFNTDAGVTISTQERSLVAALHPRQWRFGQAGTNEPSGGVFGLARQSGAQITLDLTSDWEDWAYTNDRAYYQAPYGDLSTYYTFIYNDVKQRMAANQVPDYFDVWNEPATTATPNQWLSVYGTAYRAIKAADPSAQVEGPSISEFLTSSTGQLDQRGYALSLADFFNWEMSTGDRFAAVSWHEDGTTVGSIGSPGNGLLAVGQPGGFRDYWAPRAIGDHVDAAKALLATYPALKSTQLFVNEYGPTYGVNIPGWMVGDFSALEQSGADEGMITCVNGDACTNLLDGLLSASGTPQMPYWVMRDYAQMSGQMVQTSSAGSNLYTLASRNDSTRTVSALIGRADDCWGGDQCPQFHSPASGPVHLSVSIAVPWSASRVRVSIQPLPNSATQAVGQNDVPNAPAASTSTVTVSNGTATVPISSVGDGDAYYVTVTPSVQFAGGTTASVGRAANARRATIARKGRATKKRKAVPAKKRKSGRAAKHAAGRLATTRRSRVSGRRRSSRRTRQRRAS